MDTPANSAGWKVCLLFMVHVVEERKRDDQHCVSLDQTTKPGSLNIFYYFYWLTVECLSRLLAKTWPLNVLSDTWSISQDQEQLWKFPFSRVCFSLFHWVRESVVETGEDQGDLTSCGQ